MRLSAREASRLGIAVAKPSKYRAVKTDGFDSRREHARFVSLSWGVQMGSISDLRRQPEFHCWIHGQRVCVYRADFYYVRDGQIVIEDAKGYRTPTYRLKRKLVAALFGVTIQET